MNFPAKLQQDHATMTITVTKNGSTFNVSEPDVNPTTTSQNYVGLSAQIKAYLEKYYQYVNDQTFTFQY